MPLFQSVSGRRMPVALQRLSLVLCLTLGTGTARAAVDSSKYYAWGVEVYNEIVRTLRVPGTQLFAETANANGTRSGGWNNRAFVWPISTQFRVYTALAKYKPGTYTTVMRQFSDQVRSTYWNNGYSATAGGADRYYDDNAHMVVALVEAYNVTRDSVYLTRAKETYNFVISGEGTTVGGIPFHQSSSADRNTISTLQGARGAALLYQATGDTKYLNDATRLLTWANTHVQQTNYLFAQGYDVASGTKNGFDLVNSAGMGILVNLDLYKATGTTSYLTQAQRIALSANTRWFNSSNVLDPEGYWAYELVDGLDELSVVMKNPFWMEKVDDALTWLHDNKRDPNGHYDVFWGRNGPITTTLSSWNLNEQAAVARAYLYTASVAPEPTSLLALSAAALVIGRRRR